MIFVTVGTHEQPFNRLLKEVDRLSREGIIDEEVFIQRGYSKYVPVYCEFVEFLNFKDMMEKIKKARIVITHAGPGSIMAALYNHKMPIVLPRQKQYGEHIDDHQIKFSKRMEKEKKVIAVYEIEELGTKIRHFDELVEKMGHRREDNASLEKRISNFARAVDKICNQLVYKKTP